MLTILSMGMVEEFAACFLVNSGGAVFRLTFLRLKKTFALRRNKALDFFIDRKRLFYTVVGVLV